MTRQATRIAVTCSFAGVLVLATSSCAGLDARRSTVPPVPARSEAPRVRLMQLNFGREAAFGTCVEPACPHVTRKTLAVTEAAHRPVAPQPGQQHDVPSASPSDGDRHSTVEPPPAEPTARDDEIDTHEVVVTFGAGSAHLTVDARARLAESVALARESGRIVIHGRTDSTGDPRLNESLAFARALAVRDFIRDQVPDLPNIIGINAKGNCCFTASNDTRDGRARNRRVEVVFSPAGDA
jgi:outer membrane protein OmpA-like peptidoglycan-associated protein